MGILTTQDSARSFSTYVALFGLALLITSAMYLKKLNKWEEHHSCVETLPENDKFSADILCSNYYTWRRAAIIGIIIGVMDVLLLPFLLCCGCCLVCGCTALFCACLKCQPDDPLPFRNQNAGNTTENRTTSPTNDVELTPPATNAATEPATTDDDDADLFAKCNLKNMPKPLMTLLNVIGWSVWVLLPFVGTLLIVIWIGENEAIRTRDDDLYRSALTVFVVALLNLMVFYQKFIDSVFQRCCGTKKKEKKEEEPPVEV
ncbi:hypothetical protein HA402_007526 [Bradysia odoriphaga]|nr:hypothetical protein HA402_007526 [Bradysia odoriphaga]